jgi:8-oxo-dGTP pyrophosphatase MutT (NUDIX family)
MLISRGKRNQITERLRQLFGGMPCRVQVAALPWRKGKDGVEVMLITSRGTGRWVLPKGWPEPGEAAHDSAAREAAEEAGVEGAISPDPIGRFFYSKVLDNGMEWRCEVPVFPLEVEREAKRWPEKDERTRRWFSATQAAGLVKEDDLAELISRFGDNPRQIAA